MYIQSQSHKSELYEARVIKQYKCNTSTFTLCGDSVNAMARTAHEEKLPRGWNDDGLTCIIAIGCAHQGAEHESGFIHIVGTSDI